MSGSMWEFVVVAVAVVAAAGGLRWALADFFLDEFGSPSDWATRIGREPEEPVGPEA
jgi:hypothetical protein